jgi:hypothetical protein
MERGKMEEGYEQHAAPYVRLPLAAVHKCGEAVIRGAHLTSARFPDPATILREAISLFSLLPAPITAVDEGLQKHEDDDQEALQVLEEVVKRAHDTFIELVWSQQAYSSFWSSQAGGGGTASQRSTKQAASYFRRDPWPLLRAHFVARMARTPIPAAAATVNGEKGLVLCLDLEGLWKLLVEEVCILTLRACRACVGAR